MPCPVLLGDPLDAVVFLDDPVIIRDVVWYFRESQGREGAGCRLEAQGVHDLQEKRVVPLDVLVHKPIGWFLDVLGELSVQVLSLLGQAEPPVFRVDEDPAWHFFTMGWPGFARFYTGLDEGAVTGGARRAGCRAVLLLWLLVLLAGLGWGAV